jgi:UDP-N-acetylmuramate dehydrogenase
LRSAETPVHVEANVPLAPHTTLGVGGSARWFTRAATVEAVLAAERWAAERGRPTFVLGGGSNIVVADEGFDGLVLQVAITGTTTREEGGDTLFDAGAGEPWDPLVERMVRAGLGGVECLSGIPGSVGGTPIQNVGAYGQEVADTIDAVIAVDTRSAAIVELTARECGFSYRASRFKQQDAGRFLVCRVRFRLRPGPPAVTYPDVIAYVARRQIRQPDVAQIRDAILDIRRAKGMVIDPADTDTRSVGSFFMNPVVSAAMWAGFKPTVEAGFPGLSGVEGSRLGDHAPGFRMPSGDVKVPAAWLIEHSGFQKGHIAGRAGVSSKHPLAIVNRGGATAREIVALAAQIKRRVIDTFGVWLRPEPVFVGFGSDAEVEFLQKAG